MSITRMLDRHYDEIVKGHSEENIKNLVSVDVTPAAEWLYSGTEQEIFDFREDFPTVAPPWPFCWLEFLHPLIVHSEGKRIVLPPEASFRAGLLVGSWKVKPESRREIILQDGLFEFVKDFAVRILGHSPYSNLETNNRRARCLEAYENDIEAHWMCLYNFFREFEGDLRLRCEAMFGLYLDQTGKPLMGLLMGLGDKNNLPPGTEPDALSSALIPFFFAISLIHCKNVSVLPLKDRTAKAQARHGHEPRVIYRTLNINPLRTIIKGESKKDVTKTGIKRALHICRGHFKDYRESGLFGNRFGIYWWDMQARGSKEHGEVKKDYRVKGMPSD